MPIISNLTSKATCRIVAGAYDLAMGRFPAVVRIETTNACNARCTICPHSRLKRPIAQMEDDLFDRLIDQCVDGGCKEVHLHNFGEPLLDKQLERRVRHAKSKGLAKVKIFSNGSLLTEPRARGLIEAGLDEVKISFDGATREEFESIRVPLKFDDVVDNIKTRVKLRDAMQSTMQVRVACCSTTDQQSTMRSLEKVVDGFSFGKIHNWAGENPTDNNNGDNSNGDKNNGDDNNGRIRKPCSRLWRTLTVLANGDVSLCCLDYDGQFILGRVDAETSLRDIFQGAAYRKTRLCHKRASQHEIELCRHCTKSFL